MATKTVKQSEQSANEMPIVLQSGLTIDDLTREMAPFMASVTEQIESEDPAMQETATLFAREYIGSVIDDRKVEKKGDVLAVRDRLAELYFAYLHLAERIRKAVQQAETMARRQERFAEIIRSNIEAWMLTSWDAKKITGHYREFRISKNPNKLTVLDEKQIPEEFFDEVPATKVLNKTRLAQALSSGPVPGAILETNRTRLDIR